MGGDASESVETENAAGREADGAGRPVRGDEPDSEGGFTLGHQPPTSIAGRRGGGFAGRSIITDHSPARCRRGVANGLMRPPPPGRVPARRPGGRVAPTSTPRRRVGDDTRYSGHIGHHTQVGRPVKPCWSERRATTAGAHTHLAIFHIRNIILTFHDDQQDQMNLARKPPGGSFIPFIPLLITNTSSE